MKIFLQDHRDSFTYNIAEYFYRYCSDICVKPFESYITNEEVTDKDLVILGPGPGTPTDYPQIQKFLNKKMVCPVLGICLGHQAIGAFLGGELYHSEPKFGMVEDLYLNEQNTGYKITRYHSWSVTFSKTPNVKVISKSNVDNSAMSFVKGKFYGIQFHPESIGSTVPVHFLIDSFLKINWT